MLPVVQLSPFPANWRTTIQSPVCPPASQRTSDLESLPAPRIMGASCKTPDHLDAAGALVPSFLVMTRTKSTLLYKVYLFLIQHVGFPVFPAHFDLRLAWGPSFVARRPKLSDEPQDLVGGERHNSKH